jgi:hypothetical protein
MSIVINSAMWGDEQSSTDITKSIQDKASGGYLDTVANNSLVPYVDIFGANTAVTLSDSDKADIALQAAKACGGASDEKCMTFQKNQLETVMLQKKISEQQSSANVVTGRRLTVTYTDRATGLQRTVAIPDGQPAQLGKPPVVSLPTMPTLSGSLMSGLSIFGYVIGIALYVFSIAIAWRVMMLGGHNRTAYALTLLAIIIPYSGLVTTPIAVAVFNQMGTNNVGSV